MKRTNIWLSLIAAVLAIGTLVGIAGLLSKIGNIGNVGAAPAEDDGALLTNTSDGVEYFVNNGSNESRYGVNVKSDKLEENKKYRVVFGFNEVDHQAFLKKYGLYFDYYLAPDSGNPFVEMVELNMNGIISGASYDFLREYSGRLSMYFVSGPTETGSDKASREQEILSYIKEKIRFSIYELPDDTVIQESLYTREYPKESNMGWDEPAFSGDYSRAHAFIALLSTYSDYRIVFLYNQSELEEAVRKFGMQFQYGYSFSGSDSDGGVPIAKFNTKGVSNRAYFDFNTSGNDLIYLYLLRSIYKGNDSAFENPDRDAVLTYLKEHIRYKVYKVG